MKESKEVRKGSALLGELITEIARRDRLRDILAQVEDADGMVVIREALDELERLLERRWSQPSFTLSRPSPATQPPPSPVAVPSPPPVHATSHLRPSPSITVPPNPPPRQAPAPPPAPASRARDMSVHISFSPPPEKPLTAPPQPAVGDPKPFKLPGAVEEQQPSAAAESEQPSSPSVPAVERRRASLRESDRLYVHGVGPLTGLDEEAGQVSELNIKGIDDTNPVFACATDDMVLYVSRLVGDGYSVGKNGIILMPKQDSVRMRGVHERVLIDLLAISYAVPCEFGSVFDGLPDLQQKTSRLAPRLRESLRVLGGTTTWSLSTYILDANIRKYVGEDAGTGRRDRADGSPHRTATQKRVDIKQLERILQREKRIADGILDDLRPVVRHLDVEQIIGLGGGSSDDWKLILRAVVRVDHEQSAALRSALIDVQFRHAIYQPMLRLRGGPEEFSIT